MNHNYSYNYSFLSEWFRNNPGINRREVLTALCINDYKTLQNWTDGINAMPLTQIMRFCNAFNVPLDCFFCDHDAPATFSPTPPTANTQSEPSGGWKINKGKGGKHIYDPRTTTHIDSIIPVREAEAEPAIAKTQGETQAANAQGEAQCANAQSDLSPAANAQGDLSPAASNQTSASAQKSEQARGKQQQSIPLNTSILGQLGMSQQDLTTLLDITRLQDKMQEERLRYLNIIAGQMDQIKDLSTRLQQAQAKQAQLNNTPYQVIKEYDETNYPTFAAEDKKEQ